MTIFSLSSLFCSLLITASVDNWLMIPFRSNENLWDSYLLLLLLSKCMNSSWCRIITVLMSSWRVFTLLLISRTSDFFLVIMFFIFHFNFSSFTSNSWDFWIYSSSRSLSFAVISLLRSVYSSFLLPYSTLSSLSKDQHYPKFVRGIDNGDFLFPKFYNFFTKRATGGLIDYYGIVFKKENKK